jgi:hypothetical protein
MNRAANSADSFLFKWYRYYILCQFNVRRESYDVLPQITELA